MNSEKYIGLDIHQATISVAVMECGGKGRGWPCTPITCNQACTRSSSQCVRRRPPGVHNAGMPNASARKKAPLLLRTAIGSFATTRWHLVADIGRLSPAYNPDRKDHHNDPDYEPPHT